MLLVDTVLDVSNVHGIGVFANEFIPKGTAIWKFHRKTCEVFEKQEFLNLCRELPIISIKNFLNYSYVKEGKVYYITDNTRFINHGLKPNIAFVNNDSEIATRDIYKGEELIENYYESYDSDDFFLKDFFNYNEKEVLLEKIGGELVNC